MIKQVDGQRYEIIEVFRDREDKENVLRYLKDGRIIQDRSDSTPKIMFLDDDFLEKNKLVTTPLTVILSEHGIVEKVWFGLWSTKIVADVNATFGTSIRHQN